MTNTTHTLVATCESEILVQIESRIESAATIRIESGCSRLRVQCRLNEVIIIITDEQLDVHMCWILLVPQAILHNRSYSANVYVLAT